MSSSSNHPTSRKGSAHFDDTEVPEGDLAPPPHPIMTMQHAPRDHLKGLFHCFDDDDSGFLSPEELVSLSFTLGLETNAEKIKEDFKNADSNADGKISVQEFLSWFKVGELGIGDMGNTIRTHKDFMANLESIETEVLKVKSRGQVHPDGDAESPTEDKPKIDENKV